MPIFIIFVVDLVIKIFHPQKLMPIWRYNNIIIMRFHNIDDGHGQNIKARQHSQLFSALTSNSSHCHPANVIFDTNILSRALCPSLFADVA